MAVTIVQYLVRKKCPPYWLLEQPGVGWKIIDGTDSFVYWAHLNGNSKQRRQQRRKLIRDLNQGE